jgi:hypothetical protein
MKKKVLLIALLLIASFTFQVASAQYSTKEVKQTLNMKHPKEVRKQARNYEKQGYKEAVGALSIERQLTNAWMKEVETDEKGFPKYLFAGSTSVGETQIAAKLQATETAKLDLAGQIATSVAALIETNIANSQLNTEEAASVTKTVAASKSLISQQLGQVVPVVEMYRNIDKNMEANVRLAYSKEMAIEQAKQVVRKSLEEQTQIMQDKLDKLMNF